VSIQYLAYSYWLPAVPALVPVCVPGLVRNDVDLFLDLVHHETMGVETCRPKAEHHGNAHIEDNALSTHGRTRAAWQIVLFDHERFEPPLDQKSTGRQAPDARPQTTTS
jgi:hypothetical protein